MHMDLVDTIHLISNRLMRKLEKLQQDKKVQILGTEASVSLKGGTTGNHIDLLDWSIGVNGELIPKG